MSGVTTTSLTAGQFRYTWTLRSLAGTRGFGLSGVSDALSQRVPWVQSQLKSLQQFPRRADNSKNGLASYRMLERRIAGTEALLISKTYQHDTGDRRTGNYCVQVLVAPKEVLTVSMAAAIADECYWISPYSPIDITQKDLLDVVLPAHRAAPPVGRGDVAVTLLQSLVVNGWQVSWARQDLPERAVEQVAGTALEASPQPVAERLPVPHADVLAELVAVLPPAADVGTSFVLETDVDECSLSISVDVADDAGTPVPGVRVQTGDVRWQELQRRLGGQRSLDAVRTLLGMYFPATVPHGESARHAGGHQAHHGNTELNEVERYLAGDGAAFQAQLQSADDDGLALSVGLIEVLATRRLMLNCSSPVNAWISGLVVGHAENAVPADVLDSVLPVDSEQVRILAAKVLSPATVRALADTGGDSRSRLTPESIAAGERIWPTLRDISTREQIWQRLLPIIVAGTGPDRPFLTALMDATPVDVALLFEDMLPDAFGATDEAIDVVFGPCWAAFCEWRAMPAFYAQLLPARHRRSPWLMTLFGRRNR